MTKYIIRFVLLSFMLFNFANTGFAEEGVGFLWYNLPKDEPESTQPATTPGIPFNQLSYTDQDKVLAFYTMEALHKAHHTKSIEDVRIFYALQDYWLREATDFAYLSQKTMLLYPEYDHTVTHPTSGIGTRLRDDLQEAKQQAAIKKLSQTHGLLFFYRGSNREDQRQIPILLNFCERFNLNLLPITVDGHIPPTLQGMSREDSGQAAALNVRFFPALLLVNPKTKITAPIAYGLTTQDVLEQRLFMVTHQFKGEGL